MDTNARPTASRTLPRLMPRLWLAFGVLALGAALAVQSRADAQQEQSQAALATAEELHDLVGPIALYPDDLVAIVLPASTYPLQVVQAARFLEDRKRDSSLQPNDDWDDSIVALLNYPEALKLLNDDLDWTYDLGAAVLNQRADVLSAIQDFRDEAYAAGNLRSDERQTVARNDDTIEIKPADPKVIYVPYYEPERVVVYQPAPVYYYYPQPYPVYYYPYPSHYHFGTSFFWGVNTWFSIGWHSHVFHVYDPFYYGHPYYGWTYYNPFYVRNVYVNVNHIHRYPNYVWEPQHRYGGRPVVRGSEGRVYTADRTPRRGVLDAGAATARTREGSAYRTPAEQTSGAANAGGAQQQRSRGVASSAYRNRSAATGAPSGSAGSASRASPGNASANARAAAPSPRPSRAAPADGNAQARAADAAPATPRTPAYRSGGGMSQALERSRAATQPRPDGNSAARTSPGAARATPGVSPRAFEGSTGAPREAARSTPPPRYQRSEAPPSQGGGVGAQRSAPRGNAGGAPQGGGDGGGSYRSSGHSRSPNAGARHVR